MPCRQRAPARRALLLARGSGARGATLLDVEGAEAALVLLHHRAEQHAQALGRERTDDDAVGELDRDFLLAAIPRLVDAEQHHHFLARAADVADVRVGAIHVRVVPLDLGAFRRRRGAAAVGVLGSHALNSSFYWLDCLAAPRGARRPPFDRLTYSSSVRKSKLSLSLLPPYLVAFSP